MRTVCLRLGGANIIWAYTTKLMFMGDQSQQSMPHHSYVPITQSWSHIGSSYVENETSQERCCDIML